jgi:hypothetical protein
MQASSSLLSFDANHAALFIINHVANRLIIQAPWHEWYEFWHEWYGFWHEW